jgi:hypothetical protein
MALLEIGKSLPVKAGQRLSNLLLETAGNPLNDQAASITPALELQYTNRRW